MSCMNEGVWDQREWILAKATFTWLSYNLYSPKWKTFESKRGVLLITKPGQQGKSRPSHETQDTRLPSLSLNIILESFQYFLGRE